MDQMTIKLLLATYKALEEKDSDEGEKQRVEIKKYLFAHKETLPVEIIIESLTEIGDAPSILYDDNGRFAVGSDGSQPVAIEPLEGFWGDWIFEKHMWRPSIREAVYAYLDTILESDKSDD